MSKIDFYHGQEPTGTYIGFLFSYGRFYERLPTASVLLRSLKSGTEIL